jgi:hypothetical protein
VLGDLRVGVPACVGRRGGVVRVLHVDLVVNLSRGGGVVRVLQVYLVVNLSRVVIHLSLSELRDTRTRERPASPAS